MVRCRAAGRPFRPLHRWQALSWRDFPGLFPKSGTRCLRCILWRAAHIRRCDLLVGAAGQRMGSDGVSSHLDWENIYFKKIEQLTRHALERCPGKFLVGYTDLHPGLDCAAAWRDPLQLCYDMVDQPDQVKRLIELATQDFERIYDHFDQLLKAAGQLSVSWMGIPSYGRMHIPSCDFSAYDFTALFQEFGLPILQREVKSMTHNIFHVDGKGVARHLEAILSVPEVHAVQWVQGVGDDYAIMQWVPFIAAADQGRTYHRRP